MKVDRDPFPLEFARELVEEALAAAARRADAELQDAFREEKEAIDGIEIVDIREERIDALDSHWMERFRVSEPIERILAGHPGVEKAISHCELQLARSKDEERAFLYVAGPMSEEDAPQSPRRPMLVVKLMAETLLELDPLEALLTTPLVSARKLQP